MKLYSFTSPYLAPSEVWNFVHCAATEEADAYFKSLTREEFDQYWDDLHGYCPKFSYGDKEDLCYFVDEALVNPDWVTPELFLVCPPAPPLLKRRASRRPAQFPAR